MPNDSMNFNFNLLKERVLTTSSKISLLRKIKGSTLCVGSGGSKVVASFSSTVLSNKNNCLTKVLEPRDVLYENKNSYKNIFMCSYSGNNHGVNVLNNIKKKKYLLTNSEQENKYYKKIKYSNNYPKELSFISLASTLMPMTSLLSYYTKDYLKLIKEMFTKIENTNFNIKNINLEFDVISGNDTLTPEIYLDSTFVEAGLSSIIRHSKYDYCHGRTTLPFKEKRNLIYLVNKRNELDDLLLSILKEKYDSIIILESNYNDLVINNYDLTLQAIYLTKYIAEKKNLDLSEVIYEKETTKLLYKFKGNM